VALNKLESAALDAFRTGGLPERSGDDLEDWGAFAITQALIASRSVREAGLTLSRDVVNFKGDGSPATELERNVETALRTAVEKFDSKTVFVGEETGGALHPEGRALGVDPVDGTWAFVTGTETYATTLTLFDDGKPVVAVIGNPATGEIAYAIGEGKSRLMRVSAFGEPDGVVSLPTEKGDSSTILVNLHPSRTAADVSVALQSAWADGKIRMVRSPGGSPSWALVEAARGAFTYVNLWSKRASEPYDLAGGALIIRNAGGEICGLDGSPIDAVRHKGPFVAGVDGDSMRTVIQLVINSQMEGEGKT
jgi:fructose-1,6-bisphosphatase/inositol monophosphatase family enzyme